MIGQNFSERSLFPGVASNSGKFSSSIQGRGIAKSNLLPGECLCQRPYKHILCLNCGHLMFGRVRYICPRHLMITFLIDITNCPKCRCYEYMLQEVNILTKG